MTKYKCVCGYEFEKESDNSYEECLECGELAKMVSELGINFNRFWDRIWLNKT